MAGKGQEQDVIELLMEDHREVRSLIRESMETIDDVGKRRELASNAIANMVAHTVAEEQIVYPFIKETLPDGAPMVQQDLEEHRKMDDVMLRMEQADPNTPAFAALAADMEKLMLAHTDFEENVQFPQLRERASRESLVDLANKVKNVKHLAAKHPHPSAPHAASFHKLVGPAMGLADRLRDMLTGST